MQRMGVLMVVLLAAGCRCGAGGPDGGASGADAVNEDQVRMVLVAPARGTIRDAKGRALATTRVDRSGPGNRIYPLGKVASHLVGHMQPVSDTMMKGYPNRGYAADEKAGRGGMEEAFEEALRGKPGFRKVVVDTDGKPLDDQTARTVVVGPLERKPRDGLDVHSSVDADLMTLVHKAFVEHEMGGAVVMEVETGRVLAYYSRPGYDPTSMSRGPTHEEREALTRDPRAPLLDRVAGEARHPASTFKTLTALAALESGVLEAQEVMDCRGQVQVDGHEMTCHGVHGKLDVRGAIAASCNAFFYRVGMKLGLKELLGWTRQMGFGERTGIALPGELAGHVPGNVQGVQEDAGPALAASVSCGHGPVKATLLQMASAYAAIANGGRLYTPTVVDRITGADGTLVEAFEPHVRRNVQISEQVRQTLLAALTDAVDDPRGTGHSAKRDDIAIAGKSGTSQVKGRGLPPELVSAQDGLVNEAFFVALAPAQDPKLVMVVYVENAQTGGATAAPIASRVLGDYLMKKL